ncbi:MAG TPA: TonB-dependent receptor [Rhizomicrobium sp.]
MNFSFKHLLACSVAIIALPGPAAAAAQPHSADTSSQDAAGNVQIVVQQSDPTAAKPQKKKVQVAVNNDQAVTPALVLHRSNAAPATGGGRAGATQDDLASTESVTVTGSRIVTNGNNSPTPLTVVSTEQLQATTPSNIPDGLNKLPVFNSTQTPNQAASGANGRGANMPGNFLNLRNLGTIRTLVLEDGRRVPGTFYDTTVDTDMLPQMLIQRVEVVTGGASAVYGSDAVSGVVNFILDHDFQGLKGVVQGGISGYGDARSFRLGVANGFDVGSHGHFEWSAEYYDRDALPDQSARPLGDSDSGVVGTGAKTNPNIFQTNLRRSNAPPGGLVTTGPFAGQQFLDNGQLGGYNPGTPTTIANVAVGGDGGHQKNEYLLPVLNNGQVFGRFDYDLTSDIHGYMEARYSMARTYEANQGFDNTPTGYPITIYGGNPFLPAAAQAQMNAAGTSSFQMNRLDNDLSQRLGLTSQVGALSISAGANGKAWGDFTWDAYYTHGETRSQLTTNNNVNTSRFYAATDAVNDPATGKTVCNVSLTAPGAFPGCVPYNLFGSNNASQAAKDYVDGTTSWTAHNGLDDFGANLTGTAFEGWAGPIKIAVGGEYRLASLNVDTTTPDDSFDPSYLRLGPNGNSLPSSYPAGNLKWFKEVQSGAKGSENVTEGNFEINAPLLKNLPLAELVTFNGAYRYTQYSASGGADAHSNFSSNTWKLGLEWQMFDDLRLRATRSRDIRAPTLWDLYQEQEISSSGMNDNLTGISAAGNTVVGGNPNLKPEVARNTTAGAVYTPSWLPGFSASADYYHIVINNAIGTVNGLDPVIQGYCFSSGGTSPYCGLVQRPISYNDTSPANFPTKVYNLSQNIAHIYAEGMDFEVNYGTDLNDISSDLNGFLNMRLLWTHQPTMKNQSLPGAVITNDAGTTADPSDKATFILDYKLDGFSVDLMERYYSAVHWGSNPTLIYNIPDIRAYYQTDVNLSYDFMAGDVPATGFLNVNNLFDVQGQDIGGYTSVIGMFYPVAPYADVIGRYFTVGVRFKT